MIEIGITVYITILIALSLMSYIQVKNSNDFLYASKSGGTAQITGSLVSTILGSSAILGGVELAAKIGWAGVWFLSCGALALWLLIPFSKHVYEKGKFSLPHLLGYYYGPSVKKLASIIIPIAWVGIVAAQIIGGAKVLSPFLGWSYEFTAFCCYLLFVGYTILGGQISILKTDFFQFLVLIVSLGVTSWFCYQAPGHKIESFFHSSSAFPFNEHFGWHDLMAIVLTYASTFLVGPDIYSRLYCAKNHKIIKKALFLSGLILLGVAFSCAYLGNFSKTNLVFATDKQSTLIVLGVKYLPTWACMILIMGLFSAILSSADTVLVTSSTILCQLRPNWKEWNDKKKLNWSRGWILTQGTLALLVSLKFPSLLKVFFAGLSVYAGAFVVPCLMGFKGWRSKGNGVLLGMILGGSLFLVGQWMLQQENKLNGIGVIFLGGIINYLLIRFFSSRS